MKNIKLLLLIIGCSMLVACGIAKASDLPNKEITVFAAASMTESLNEAAKDYEKSMDGKVKITLNFAGSQALKTSIENGAKADIFIAASTNYMDELKDKGYIDQSKIFLGNKLVVLINNSSSYKIVDLKDLTQGGLKIAVGDKSVPVGMYWDKAFNDALISEEVDTVMKKRIEENIKTKELNVKDIVSKVFLNEVDVGIAYKTDVKGANSEKLRMIDIKAFEKHKASYPIGVLKTAKDREEVNDFYKYLISEKTIKIFEKNGFTAIN